MTNTKIKRICYHCIGEKYLRNEVRKKGKRSTCSYCGRRTRSYLIEEIALRIEVAFDQHYRRTPDQPDAWEYHLHSDPDSDYSWARHGEPAVWAIANATNITEEAATDIQSFLEEKYFDFEAATLGEETEFNSEAYYEEKQPNDEAWQGDWKSFEKYLKTEARFLSSNMLKYLETIFIGIDTMSTIDGRPILINAGPESDFTTLYRARVFQSDDMLKEALCRPDQHIGPPPAILTIAGRMNAHGISVFYGSNEQSVAIAEVRPPVGSQVVVARFDIIRPLRLLDLTALRSVMEKGSIFDPEWSSRLERAFFLRSLSLSLTQPVMPDHEAFEYLPTQAIADYLANEHDPMVDGIIFPTVQAGGQGLNIVLFHKSANVESMAISEGTKIEANTGYYSDDGWEIDYSVAEHILPQKTSTTESNTRKWPALKIFDGEEFHKQDAELQNITLRIDIESIQVHIVRSVKYEYESHRVSRHQFKLHNDDILF